MLKQLLLVLLIPTTLFSYQNKKSPSLNQLLEQLQKNTSNSMLIYDIAKSYENQGDITNALSYYQKCLYLSPDYSKYYISISKILRKLNRPDKGFIIMTNAVSNFTQNPDVYCEMGEIYLDLGYFKQSLDSFQKSDEFEMDFKNKDQILLGLGKSWAGLKKYTEAENCFKAILKNKNDTWVFYELGKLYLECEKFESAVWAFRKARAYSTMSFEGYRKIVQSRLAQSLYLYAMELKDKGRKKDSKAIFESILKDPGLRSTDYSERAEFWLKRL